MMMERTVADGRGRPRGFDLERALEQTLGRFWQCGYLGTSYSDICKATGLSKPSLYAALGNKESTFLAALDLYVSRYVQPGIEILDREPNAKKAIHELLCATVEGLTEKTTPQGCFIATNSACANTPQVPKAVAEALRAAASQTGKAVAARLEHALGNRQIPPRTDIGALTIFYSTVIAGLSSLAKHGAPKKDLKMAVEIAMSSWPAKTTT